MSVVSTCRTAKENYRRKGLVSSSDGQAPTSGSALPHATLIGHYQSAIRSIASPRFRVRSLPKFDASEDKMTHPSTHSATKVALALVLLLAMTACGGAQKDSDGSAEATPKKRFLSIGTAPPGGAFFVVGGALAEVANGAPGWDVTAEATKGSRENIRRLLRGDLDFGLSNAAITYFALRGEAGWEKPYPVRSVMTLAPNVALFIARADSDVKTIADLAGKRVVIGPAGAGFEMFVTPILAAHGVSYDDFTALNNTQSGAVDMLSDGSADAAFLGGAVPTASIVQASASMDLHFVPFDEDARASLLADYPFYAPTTIPAETYRGQEADFAGLVVGAMHLLTAESVDEAVVYTMTKTLYENRAQVVERHPAGRAINPKNVVADKGTPFHPGAIRYFKEAGIWPDEAAAAAPESAEAAE